ncbi:MAG TPA: hypothetical protein VKI17_08480 [Gemmataceae bacterium]|nr:hypothetical protein [Gemmataceae bacterium]
MTLERTRHIARIDKNELADMPTAWSNRERGQYLRMLLSFRGINPDLLFQVEYYPYRCCWLLIQELDPDLRPPSRAPLAETAEAFYVHTMIELRRSARVAFAAAAAKSSHFACHGCAYQLPAKPQEASAFDPLKLVGSKSSSDFPVRFTAEGGWQSEPSEN